MMKLYLNAGMSILINNDKLCWDVIKAKAGIQNMPGSFARHRFRLAYDVEDAQKKTAAVWFCSKTKRRSAGRFIRGFVFGNRKTARPNVSNTSDR